MRDMLRSALVQVPVQVAKIVEVPAVPGKSEFLRKRISEMVGCEVSTAVASMIKRVELTPAIHGSSISPSSSSRSQGVLQE